MAVDEFGSRFVINVTVCHAFDTLFVDDCRISVAYCAVLLQVN